jgi:hypothetical protein
MLIGDIFERDVTRAIPPVVYFHEQEPGELQREVEEYIITGGYPPGDPRATEEGIHEQFVHLLTAMRTELGKSGGPELPACWISGFYGSGKSSFAKLLGLSLDGRTLPDGTALSEALLAQDRSPDAAKLHLAWRSLVDGIQPIAVVFDVGSKARDYEHIHAVAVRQVQHRLGYSTTSNLVAEYELKLELEGLYEAFLQKAQEVHARSWTKLKDSQLVEDAFAAVMHALQPEIFTDPQSWVLSRSGSVFEGKRSADEAVVAIQQMLDQRLPGRTVFIVIDEVSQYVHEDDDRMLALQSFVSALGQRMRGRAWVLATGQQKLEEAVGTATAILKLKDRFPRPLRVHLGIANIRDVVHKRLLRKKKVIEADLRELFLRHRADLVLYAYRGEEISETDFVEVYPMLPGHVGLLLDITTGLRSRSTRTQGDSHAIRGLLQLLGDLFREKDLARFEVGRLITLDLIYDVLHSALNADVQMTIARGLEFCARQHNPLMARVVKAVALLELVQDHQKTSADLIARCLYEQLGQGNLLPDVQKALDALAGESIVAYSEKTGYKIESSAGQEWQRERDGYAAGLEQLSAKVQQALSFCVADVDRVSVEGLSLPWLALLTDASVKDARIKDERKYTVVTVDFQLSKGQGKGHDAEQWVPRSDNPPYRDRIVWVSGDLESVHHAATKVVRSDRMIERYGPRQGTLPEDKQRLIIEERNRLDVATKELQEAVKGAFMAGQLYFRGRQTGPRDLGSSFASSLAAFGQRIVGELYPHPTTYSVSEKDIQYLIDNTELVAPPPVLCQERLGLLALDSGRYEVKCNGRVPMDVIAYVKDNPGVTGASLLEHFGRPPHGTPPDVIRAVVVGLLRGGRVRVEMTGAGELTSVRDEGARDLLKDTGLRKARLFENTKETLSPRDRNAICALFRDLLGADIARDNDAIAIAVADKFARVRDRLTSLAERFRRLPRDTDYPETLTKLERALETCRRDRRVEPTVLAVKRSLPALRDGLTLLRRMESDLTDEAIDTLRQAEDTWKLLWPGLASMGATEQAHASAKTIQAHLETERPWEDAGELAPHVELVRETYRAKRRGILDAHATKVDGIIERLKRRDGMERLDPDQRYEVLRYLSEGAASGTDDKAVAPPLEALEALLAMRRETAEAKALAQLDALLGTPTVDVVLDFAGREIKTEADLERVIDELRRKVLLELGANHVVRLKH